MIIYKATNTVNGKVYIGQTKRPLAIRIRDHRHNRHGHGILHSAIRKYGIDAFTFDVIDTAGSKPELDLKEIKWIAHYDCKAPNGYNLSDGGKGNPGYRLSEEARAKIRARAIGRVWSKESKHPGGRPCGVRMPCGWGCNAMLTAREIRNHFVTCPKRPKPFAAQEAFMASIPKHSAYVGGQPVTARPAGDILSALRRLGTLER